MEASTPTSRGACLAAGATAHEAKTGLARDLAHGERGRARTTEALACRMDTRESIAVGARPGGLLAHSWALGQGLHTPRHSLATPLR
jgi:hypothetical protein